jgi:oligosaccharide repeat unit polymerase
MLSFNDLGNKYILIMIGIYFLTFYTVFQIKNKKKGLAYFLFLYYLVSSIFSLILYNTSESIYVTIDNIQLAPIIYVTTLILISASPILFLKDYNGYIIDTRGNNLVIRYISFFIGIISIPIIISSIISLSSFNISSFADAYTENSNDNNHTIISVFINTLMKLLFIINPILFILLSNSKKYKYELISCIFGILAISLIFIQSGGRGALVNFFVLFFFCYFMTKKNIPKYTLNKLNKIITYSSISVFIIIFFITISRFYYNEKNRDNIALVSWISLYLGEGPLRFSQYMWDSNIRTNGDNSFSFIKNATGYKTFKENKDRREYWETKQYIPNFIFYTYVGDIYSDLGKKNTFIYISLIALIFIYYIKSIKNTYISIFHFVILEILFQRVFLSFMNFCNKTYISQYIIFVTIVILIFLWFNKKFRLI